MLSEKNGQVNMYGFHQLELVLIAEKRPKNKPESLGLYLSVTADKNNHLYTEGNGWLPKCLTKVN